MNRSGEPQAGGARERGRARWRVSLLPTAGEAGGSYWSERSPDGSVSAVDVLQVTAFRARVREARGESPAGRGKSAEELEAKAARARAEAVARARAEAVRRAHAKVRRYCVANRLTRLSTLTYAGEGCYDPRVLRQDVGEFMRQLRQGMGERIAYLWVPEWHAQGHGLHIHFAVGRYVPRGLIERSWGRGYVSIKLLGDLPIGTNRAGEARKAAGYLAKYVSKTFDSEETRGLHRYEVAQGFQPRAVAVVGRTDLEILERASAYMGGEPNVRWYSNENPDWHGPPAIWFQWAYTL
jgi:hypothetical protein